MTAMEKKTAADAKPERRKRKKPLKRTPVGQEVAQVEEEHGADSVVKLSEMDSLRFGKLDAEVRNAMQGIRIATLEIDQANTLHAARLGSLETHRAQLKSHLETLRPQYDALVREIATKHGIDDPKHMVVDPETGTVRDARTDL